jgi:alpha-tubulin suppressor-like RCC1 family protein
VTEGQNERKISKVALKDKKQGKIVPEELVCGLDHCLLLDVRGRLYGWGSSRLGELGVNHKKEDRLLEPTAINLDLIMQNIGQERINITEPKKLGQQGHYRVSGMCAGDAASYLIINDQLIATGNKFRDQNQNYPLVMNLTGGVQVKGVSCAVEHGGLWDFNGRAYTWGFCRYGKLGHPNSRGSFTPEDMLAQPKQVVSLGDKKIAMMALGEKYTVFLSGGGELYQVGLLRPFRNLLEQEMDLIQPKHLGCYVKNNISGKLDEIAFVKVCSGFGHCLAADRHGKIYAWGENFEGCLGIEGKGQKEPQMIVELKDFGVIDFACGPNFSVVVVDVNGADFDEKIYLESKMSHLVDIRQKMYQRKKKVVNKTPMTEITKMIPKDSIMKQVDDYFRNFDFSQINIPDQAEVEMRKDSKKVVLRMMVDDFLMERFSIEEYGEEYARMMALFKKQELDFEQIFYKKILTNPELKDKFGSWGREVLNKEKRMVKTARRPLSRSTAALGSGHQNEQMTVKDLDAVSVAVSTHFSAYKPAQMKISQILSEEHQFKSKVDYMKTQFNISKKMSLVKETQFQRCFIASRKTDFRITKNQEKKQKIEETKFAGLETRYREKQVKLSGDIQWAENRVKNFKAWQMEWMNFMNLMVFFKKVDIIRGASK